MDSEKKVKKIMAYLNIPYEQIDQLPDKISILETCLNTESKESSFLLPTETNSQLPEIFLRTKLLDESNTFIDGNFTEVTENWNKNIDKMISKWESFEFIENIDEEELPQKEIDMDLLKKMIQLREQQINLMQ